MSCELAHDDAAYVLGALSSTERLAFEGHLADCEGCRARVHELAGLPGLLAKVPDDVWEDGADEPLPQSVLPQLLHRARRERRRRAWFAATAAAAALVVAAVGGAVVATRTGKHAPPPAAGRPMRAAVVDAPVDASVALDPVAWGTRVRLTCRYDTEYPLPKDRVYRLVLRSREGATEQVASWSVVPGRTMHVVGATSVARDDIADVEVRTDTGRPVLWLTGR